MTAGTSRLQEFLVAERAKDEALSGLQGAADMSGGHGAVDLRRLRQAIEDAEECGVEAREIESAREVRRDHRLLAISANWCSKLRSTAAPG